MDDYVLDLRGNLGGVLDGALQIAALFLQQVLILKKKIHKEKRVLKKKTSGPKITQSYGTFHQKKNSFLSWRETPQQNA